MFSLTLKYKFIFNVFNTKNLGVKNYLLKRERERERERDELARQVNKKQSITQGNATNTSLCLKL